MTQKEKDLLLKDLCSRLPYGVMAKFGDSNPSKITNITQCIDSNSWFAESEGESDGMICPINNVKPYLFPLSSMTEEQKQEYNGWKHMVPVCHYEYGDVIEEIELFESPASFDYLIENHFDYYGLIPLGLAEDATGLNIY